MTFLKYKGLYLTLAIAFIILFLSLQPLGEGNPKLLVSDKLLHFIAYGVMVIPVSLEKVYPQFFVFLIALTFGGFIELIQPFWGRKADIIDLCANISGIIFGILIARAFLLILRHMRQTSTNSLINQSPKK